MAKQIMGIDSSVFRKLIDVRRFSNNIDIDGWCKLRERGLDHFNVEPVNISLRGKGDLVGILGNHSIILRHNEVRSVKALRYTVIFCNTSSRERWETSISFLVLLAV